MSNQFHIHKGYAYSDSKFVLNERGSGPGIATTPTQFNVDTRGVPLPIHNIENHTRVGTIHGNGAHFAAAKLNYPTSPNIDKKVSQSNYYCFSDKTSQLDNRYWQSSDTYPRINQSFSQYGYNSSACEERYAPRAISNQYQNEFKAYPTEKYNHSDYPENILRNSQHFKGSFPNDAFSASHPEPNIGHVYPGPHNHAWPIPNSCFTGSYPNYFYAAPHPSYGPPPPYLNFPRPIDYQGYPYPTQKCYPDPQFSLGESNPQFKEKPHGAKINQMPHCTKPRLMGNSRIEPSSVHIPTYLYFDGSQDCVEFIAKFKAFLKWYDINGYLNQYQYFFCLLKGNAAKCLNEITYAYPNIKNMEELLTIFPNEFRNYSRPSLLSLFLEAHQEGHESAIDWANRISELSQQASIFLGSNSELVDKQAARKFINGLSDKRLACFLAGQDIKNVLTAFMQILVFCNALQPPLTMESLSFSKTLLEIGNEEVPVDKSVVMQNKPSMSNEQPHENKLPEIHNRNQYQEKKYKLQPENNIKTNRNKNEHIKPQDNKAKASTKKDGASVSSVAVSNLQPIDEAKFHKDFTKKAITPQTGFQDHSNLCFTRTVLSESYKSCKVTEYPYNLKEHTSDSVHMVIIANSLEELIARFKAWRDGMEKKGLKVNIPKTVFMISGTGLDVLKDSGRYPYPCSVCRKGVGADSIYCTGCAHWAKISQMTIHPNL